MTDTNIDVENPAASAATPPISKGRVASEIAGSVVTLTQGGTDIGTFDLAALPAPVGAAIAVMGLRDYLIRADDPVAAYAKLASGNIPGKKTAAAKELDPWPLAYAHARAEADVKAAGNKVYLPGGKNHTPEMKMALDEAKQRAAKLDRALLAEVKLHPDVVAHWRRITGKSGELL